MALKSYRPLTPIQRFKQTPAFDEITKWTPAKSLLEPKKKSGGRNNYGRMTSRHIGGGPIAAAVKRSSRSGALTSSGIVYVRFSPRVTCSHDLPAFCDK